VCYKNTKCIGIALLGLIEQDTIDDLGQIIMKNWITHDQLFRDPSNLSVNKCVRDMELPTYMFSFAL